MSSGDRGHQDILVTKSFTYWTNTISVLDGHAKTLYRTSKEPVCPRVELIFKIIIILLIIFLGFIKSKPC